MKNHKTGLWQLTKHVFFITTKKAPLAFGIYAFVAIACSLFDAANTVFKQHFFDAVEATLGSGTISKAVTAGIIMGLFMVFAMVLDAASQILEKNCFRKVQGFMGINLNRKAARIDPVVFENNHTLDQINKAYQGLEASAEVASAVFHIIFMNIPFLIFFGSYLFNVKPMLLVMMAFSFLPSIFGAIIRYRLYAKMENSAAPHRRRYEYYGRCIHDREYAKETRLLGGFSYFYRLFRESIAIVANLSWKAAKKTELTEIALHFVVLSGYIATMATLFYYLINGEVGIGIFAAVLSSIDHMFDMIERMLNYRLGAALQKLGLAENYMAFLALPERGGINCKLKSESFSLKNVSFAYPSSEKNAITKINLDIAKGETIAVVGENGAGKSTLVRLITGLYLPSHGDVMIDGVNTKEISAKSIYSGISAVFQRFQRYKMTVADNVTISDSNAMLTEKNIKAALRKAEFSIENESLTKGLDTMLGRDFGGIDLSGGQWQRLAIARGFYRAHNMIVLDEPTAAIDPIEESSIYNKFTDISKGKTAIIVTHRLGSAKIADRIIVMENGCIAEIGTHESLIKNDGIYSKMYNAQAQWYDAV